MSETRTFATEHERYMAEAEAEQLSRQKEALANFAARRAARDPNTATKSAIKSALSELADAERERQAIAGADVTKDYSGTVLNVADSAGNPSANAEVANAGGVNVQASNTEGGKADGGAQATSAEQVPSPVVATAEQQKAQAEQAAKDAAEAEKAAKAKADEEAKAKAAAAAKAK